MARDKGLEALISDDLGDLPGLTQKAMFGGLAWLLDGKLLCGARTARILVRLGLEDARWALAIPGITTAVLGPRAMPGWLFVAPEVYANDELRQQLLRAAIQHVRALPRKL